MSTSNSDASLSAAKKVLVAYYSHTGTTRSTAQYISKSIHADIFEIQAVDPYPEDYEEVKERAKQELESDMKPKLKTRIENIEQYDVVCVGYPIWWGTFPAPVKSFLSDYDLAGKSVAPFCTHEGSGLGHSVADISKLCPKSQVPKAAPFRVKISRKLLSGYERSAS